MSLAKIQTTRLQDIKVPKSDHLVPWSKDENETRAAFVALKKRLRETTRECETFLKYQRLLSYPLNVGLELC